MNPNLLHEALHATPFKPFVLKMMEGDRAHLVDRPDVALLATNGWAVAVANDAGVFSVIELSMVASLDYQPAPGPKAAQRAEPPPVPREDAMASLRDAEDSLAKARRRYRKSLRRAARAYLAIRNEVGGLEEFAAMPRVAAALGDQRVAEIRLAARRIRATADSRALRVMIATAGRADYRDREACIDAQDAAEALAEYKKTGVSFSWEEVKAELGL